jgi:hypothetical protein
MTMKLLKTATAGLLLLFISVAVRADPCRWLLWHQIETEKAAVWKPMDGYATLPRFGADSDVMTKRAKYSAKRKAAGPSRFKKP